MVARAVPCLLLVAMLLPAQPPAPPIENDRLLVLDGTFPAGPAALDTVRVQTSPRKATFYKKGAAIPASGKKREVRVQLKDRPATALENRSGFPNAFPRAGARKILETDRTVTWEYEWHPKEPTVMHFHDKDVVVVYFETGTLRSTTPDGMVTDNPYTPTTVRFNLRNRTHTELLISGKQHAIMTELK